MRLSLIYEADLFSELKRHIDQVINVGEIRRLLNERNYKHIEVEGNKFSRGEKDGVLSIHVEARNRQTDTYFKRTYFIGAGDERPTEKEWEAGVKRQAADVLDSPLLYLGKAVGKALFKMGRGEKFGARKEYHAGRMKVQSDARGAEPVTYPANRDGVKQLLLDIVRDILDETLETKRSVVGKPKTPAPQQRQIGKTAEKMAVGKHPQAAALGRRGEPGRGAEQG